MTSQPDAAHSSRTPPLSVAARTGDADTVRKLLEEGQRVDDFDSRGWKPLHEAAAAGHVACAVLLLRHDGAIKDLVTDEGETALFLSVNPDSNLDVMKVLLNHSADVNLGNNAKFTPLHKACELDLLPFAQLLLESRADVNAADSHGNRPIHEAIKKRSAEMVDLLLRYEADLKVRNSDRHTPLMTAASIGFHEVIKKLDKPELRIVNDCQYGNITGETALMLAVQGGCLKTTKVLLEMGADANIVRDNNQQTALHLAVRRGDPRLLECLVWATDVNKVANSTSIVPLIMAIDKMQVKLIELLLDWMDDHSYLVREVVECQNDEIVAQDYRVLGAISYLLYNKAQGAEVLYVLELLLKYGCPANPSSVYEFPPLAAITASSAPKKIKIQCIEILLDNGADPDNPFPWYAKMYMLCWCKPYPLTFLPATWYYAMHLHPGEKWLIRLVMAACRKCDPDTLLSIMYVYVCINALLDGQELRAFRRTLQCAFNLALELGYTNNAMMFTIWSKFRSGLTVGRLQYQQEGIPEYHLVVPDGLTPPSLAKLCRIVIRRHYCLSELQKFILPNVVNDFLNYVY